MSFERPNLDARLKGILFKDIPVGTHEREYIFPFDCKFNGIISYSSVTKIGSTIRMETQYQAAPDVWYRYKKFGDDWNLFPNYACKNVLFPTTPVEGIKLLFKITNNETVPIDIGFNLYQFADLEHVDPTQGQQGADW